MTRPYIYRVAVTACWISYVLVIATFTLLWRLNELTPRGWLGAVSVLILTVPLIVTGVIATGRMIKADRRSWTVGMLMIAALPTLILSVYLVDLSHKAHDRSRPRTFGLPERVTGLWLTCIADLEASLKGYRKTKGRHTILIDNGGTPDVEKVVEEADQHIEAMAELLGVEPHGVFLQSRRYLLGQSGRVVFRLSLAEYGDDPPRQFTPLERHELAHSFIAAIAGPDQDPGRMLAEGWAELQGRSRADSILNLWKIAQWDGQHSIEELTQPHTYGRGFGPNYSHGGPFAHYLIERYGGPAFLDLYRRARQGHFDAACQTVFGVSLADLEREFWPWLDAQANDILAENSGRGSDHLAEGVSHADWLALIDGYRSSERRRPVPHGQDVAFELTREGRYQDEDGKWVDWSSTAAVVVRGDHFWARRDALHERVALRHGSRGSARVKHSDDHGTQGFESDIRTGTEMRLMLWEDVLRHYSGQHDPAMWLPSLADPRELNPDRAVIALTPPTRSDGRWIAEVALARETPGDQPPAAKGPIVRRLVIDPRHRWLVAESSVRLPDGSRSEKRHALFTVGDFHFPFEANSRHFDPSGNLISERTTITRPLDVSEADRRRAQVETLLAAQSADRAVVRRMLLVGAPVGWLLTGLLFVGIGLRRLQVEPGV